jgi:hypothetical protein
VVAGSRRAPLGRDNPDESQLHVDLCDECRSRLVALRARHPSRAPPESLVLVLETVEQREVADRMEFGARGLSVLVGDEEAAFERGQKRVRGGRAAQQLGGQRVELDRLVLELRQGGHAVS